MTAATLDATGNMPDTGNPKIWSGFINRLRPIGRTQKTALPLLEPGFLDATDVTPADRTLDPASRYPLHPPAEPAAGSPVFLYPEAAAEPATFIAMAPAELGKALAAIWVQENIEDKYLDAVKNFQLSSYSENDPSPRLYDPVSKDQIIVGVLENGDHVAVGAPNISAAQALSRAQAAMTDNFMRTEGIDEVAGTDLDKALLMLAAARVGLTINNPPQIDKTIMDKAEGLWMEMEWEQALAEAPVAPAAAGFVSAKRPAAAATTAPATDFDAAVQDAVQSGNVADKTPAGLDVEPLLEADDWLMGLDVTEGPATEAVQEMLRVEPTTDEERATVEEIMDRQALNATFKPEVLKALAGYVPSESISPALYLKFRAALKNPNAPENQSPRVTDHDGFIDLGGISEKFEVSAAVASRLIEIARIDNLLAHADRTVVIPGVKTVVNYRENPPVIQEPIAHPFPEDHEGTRFKSDIRPKFE